MSPLRQKPDIDFDSLPSDSSDPPFDLRRGLIGLIIVMGVMVGLSLICAFFW